MFNTQDPLTPDYNEYIESEIRSSGHDKPVKNQVRKPDSSSFAECYLLDTFVSYHSCCREIIAEVLQGISTKKR